ncbi:hypothetical protein GCM10008088_27600 [Mesonia mobilis]|uniref:Uncharacterized protein n=2 Tax=Mesonia mobilis TaxID=369791 RepID=A0ABQ3C1D8_9FLAO|nr:hypothetical protein GCM10008088_27600 [Mesonia mobilis]
MNYKNEIKIYEQNLENYNREIKNYEKFKEKHKNDIEVYKKVRQKNIELKNELTEIQKELWNIYDLMKLGKIDINKEEYGLLFQIITNCNLDDDVGMVNRNFYPDDFSVNKNLKTDKSSINESIIKGINFLLKLSTKNRIKILELLKYVNKIQNSNLENGEKSSKIKSILWTQQSATTKLFVGGFLGTIGGLVIFGTGGIGIAGLGGAIGIWGFLAGTTGGILISSIIQNFENKK